MLGDIRLFLACFAGFAKNNKPGKARLVRISRKSSA